MCGVLELSTDCVSLWIKNLQGEGGTGGGGAVEGGQGRVGAGIKKHSKGN